MLSQNAQVLAFGDGFALLTATCLAAAAVALLAKPGPVVMTAAPPEDSH